LAALGEPVATGPPEFFEEKTAEGVNVMRHESPPLPSSKGADTHGETRIGPYADAPAEFRPYDPLAPQAARVVVLAVTACDPRLSVEHIGSTAVPGCAGKGIIDLMVLYPAGLLEAAKETLDRMGFQHQTTRDPFPEDRPMRVGSMEYEGQQFRLHAHVLCVTSAEVEELRAFRDRLRAEPALRAAYEALKRTILAEGIVDSVAYAEAKSDFVRGCARHRGNQRLPQASPGWKIEGE
jgi:GrpB-like predicted nucleotidyltransferase (UPF0157 family)